MMQTFIRSAESFPLLAIPFFIMAGSIMNYSGISKRLMGMAEVLTGHWTGGLAQVNILLSVLMGEFPVLRMRMLQCNVKF